MPNIDITHKLPEPPAPPSVEELMYEELVQIRKKLGWFQNLVVLVIILQVIGWFLNL